MTMARTEMQSTRHVGFLIVWPESRVAG